MPTTPRLNILEVAAARDPFVAGGRYYPDVRNFRGGPNEDRIGRLPIEWVERFEADAEHIDYVVYSYHTPIAWHRASDDAWTVPDVRYSPSTTTHQRAVADLARR